MLFNTLSFLFLFFPVVLVISRILEGKKKIFFLMLLSLIFYSVHNIANLLVLILSITFNYVSAKKFSKKIYFPILLNLLILFFFKYASDIFDLSLFKENLILPLGISFFTFQQISYLLDAKYKSTQRHNIIEYAFYVSFFPQLIAGPIIKFRDMINQLKNQRSIRTKIFYHKAIIGFIIFSVGLIKKVVFADTLAEFVDPIFLDISAGQDNVGMITAWFAIICFSFQIYFDFSGYCDMATGLAFMLGFKIPINFYSPFKSQNVSQFWARWNITLTKFFTSILYNNSAVYIGRNLYWIKHKKIKFFLTQIIPFLITFSIIGIWHGSGLNFFMFGLTHAIFLSVYYIFKYSEKYSINKHLSIAITFICVTISFVFFRCENMDQVLLMFTKLFFIKNLLIPESLSFLAESFPFFNYFRFGEVYYWQGTRTLIWITLSFILCFMCPNINEIFKKYRVSIENISQNQKASLMPNLKILFLLFLFIPITYLQTIPTFYKYLPTSISVVIFFSLTLTLLFLPMETLRVRINMKICMISVLLFFISFLKIFSGRENEFIYFAF